MQLVHVCWPLQQVLQTAHWAVDPRLWWWIICTAMFRTHTHLSTLLLIVFSEGRAPVCNKSHGESKVCTPLPQFQQGLLCRLVACLVDLHESRHLTSKDQEIFITSLCKITLNPTPWKKFSTRLSCPILFSVQALHCVKWSSNSCLIPGQKSLFLVCRTIVSVAACSVLHVIF